MKKDFFITDICRIIMVGKEELFFNAWIFKNKADSSRNIWALRQRNSSKNTDRQNEKRQYQTDYAE
jgi:hypothetical protein